MRSVGITAGKFAATRIVAGKFAANGIACCALIASALFISAARADEVDEWLGKMAQAARSLNYVGTYVYQTGPRMETARITHLYEAGGEFEKVEMLDGPAREVVRENDNVRCYFPESKIVKIERAKARRYFPALLDQNFAALLGNYSVRLGNVERVAGYECRVVWLRPNDSFRYGHRLCAESKSGLVLKAAIVDGSGEPVEQAAFTSLNIGAALSRESVQSVYSTEQRGWSTDASSAEAGVLDGAWLVKEMPSGFKKVMEVRRRMSGRSEPVTQIVLSDGLAAVSIFIEPGMNAAPQRMRQLGVVSVVTRQLGAYQVTVLGEVPEASLSRIANAIMPRK